MSTKDGAASSFSSKPRSSTDPAWAYVTQESEGNKNDLRCNFCQVTTKGGIFRAKQHIVGGYRNTRCCPKCPSHVREEIKSYMEMKAARESSRAEKNKIEGEGKLGEQDIINLVEEDSRESKASKSKSEVKKELKDAECLLVDSKSKIREATCFQLQSMQNLRITSNSITDEFLCFQRQWREDFNNLALKMKDITENYYLVVEENEKLYKEVQELKGNIRVFCRIRPLLSGRSIVDYVGEKELLVMNPSKRGKEGSHIFKFNKVFSPNATQEEVYVDTEHLIKSVLDGYNVCIFAYGQTGSGKTYTMYGPNFTSKEEWGVNYRALDDLFRIAKSRKNTFIYEIAVQMVEIYNEQVRDLLSDDGSSKKLGIWSSSQPKGLAVPDASMHPVNSTCDVIKLMQVGLTNRAVGATALNERSSRSHSILTVHVRATNLRTSATKCASLQLVDLAGSERIRHSEVTGDRLREAQQINKSLSALGDVMFALSRKSSYIPYRNSKLTHILRSSLGGQAMTLMFVQINPDVQFYSETLSTLKFAERVSGVELGAARINEEGDGSEM